MTPSERSDVVKRLAEQAGFDRCGIAPLGPLPRGGYFLQWLRAGHAGTMGYLHRRRASRLDPRELLPGARSAIVAAVSYRQSPPNSPSPDAASPQGRVAMYAWGRDYHVVVRDRLEAFRDRLAASMDVPFDARICVDTSPIIERELAAQAGIGWIGKNTLVMHQSIGSLFFLGELLTTLELCPDAPAADHCGSCTRCLDACPTQAFPAAYQMDARRCISYLTIEHRQDIPTELERAIGEWVFGCDICQTVCPFNPRAPHTIDPRFAPRPPGPFVGLDEVERWTADDYARQTQDSATDRARLDMWKRNARIARKNAVQRPDPPAADQFSQT